MTPLPPYSRLSTPITLPLNCTPNFYQEIIINWIIIFHIHSSRHWNKHQPILGGKQKFCIMNQKFCREQKKKSWNVSTFDNLCKLQALFSHCLVTHSLVPFLYSLLGHFCNRIIAKYHAWPINCHNIFIHMSLSGCVFVSEGK